MKSLYDRFIDRYQQGSFCYNFPKGGFILRHGAIIAAHGNHNAMVNAVNGTLKGLISAGVIRYHVNRDVIGIDLPAKKYIVHGLSLNTLLQVVKDFKPEIVIMSQVGRKYACTLGADCMPWTNIDIVSFACGGSIK